jgi:hypothetical protein
VELQCFTPVSNSANHFTEWPAFLEPLDGDDVVVGDTKGLWLLHVPSNDPSAMQRLLPPPRPLGTPRAAPTTSDATSK